MQKDWITIPHIKVMCGRIEALVSLDSEISAFTNADLIQKVLQDFPYLPYHACKNDRGPTFSAVINSTPLPHLLEHMAIELQAKALLEQGVSSKDVLVGTTEWLNKEQTLAKVSLSFINDVIALNALKEALQALNMFLSSER